MKRLIAIAALTTLGSAALLPLAASAQTNLRLTVDSPAMVRVQHDYDDRDDYRDDYRDRDRYSYRDERDGYRRAPPPPRYERVPRAQPGFAWQPGHWIVRGNDYAWANGKWMRAPAGYVYVPKAWVERDGRYYLREARWERDHRHGRYAERDGRNWRDLDRDGVEDSRDRDLDNDGIANRYDRDVDGDGVRNERDSRPDNRYRY